MLVFLTPIYDLLIMLLGSEVFETLDIMSKVTSDVGC